jgi:hypothetical protein
MAHSIFYSTPRQTKQRAAHYCPRSIAPSLSGETGGRKSLIERGLFYLYAQPGIKVKELWNFFSLGGFSFFLLSLVASLSSFISYEVLKHILFPEKRL